MKSIAVDNLLTITKVTSKISDREYEMVIENMLCRSTYGHREYAVQVRIINSTV